MIISGRPDYDLARRSVNPVFDYCTPAAAHRRPALLSRRDALLRWLLDQARRQLPRPDQWQALEPRSICRSWHGVPHQGALATMQIYLRATLTDRAAAASTVAEGRD
ncbi:MAG: hypothetical protein M3302_07245 [Actinomycetota bacterium]|nr:hypothetical protein [Actinomycetota bacterium]